MTLMLAIIALNMYVTSFYYIVCANLILCCDGRKIINDNRVKKFHQESYQDDSSDDATYNGNSTQQQ